MINYGGSQDPFDQLRHIVCIDDETTVNSTYTGSDVPDCYYTTSDGHSGSETFATRGQAMQLLYELAGKPAVSGTSRFTDVPSDCPYADAVRWGEANNICFGYPRICDNTFCPDELINREDFALMAHRYAGVLGFGTATDYGRTDWYDDFLDIDYYGWVAFTWAMQWQVLTPTGNNCLHLHEPSAHHSLFRCNHDWSGHPDMGQACGRSTGTAQRLHRNAGYDQRGDTLTSRN